MTRDTSPREQKRQAAREQRERRARRRKLVALVAGVFAVALLAIGLTALQNQDRSQNKSDPANSSAAIDAASFSGGPRLAVDQSVVDHGVVAYGHEVKAEYRVRNVGDQLLRIENPEVKILDGC